MKSFAFIIVFLFVAFFNNYVSAQLKAVWELPTGDTATQAGVYRQVNNVLNAAPDTKIEIVFHGDAVYALLNDTGYYKQEILKLHQRGVLLAVCNNSLKKRTIDPKRVIQQAFVVPSAFVEIIRKQQEGWSYIKGGD
ncbi:MAG: DsrE family protein [Chitinophagaceae bacterium]|nr:DsrE family protein [Chitinophagaceae bacterium]